MLNSSSRWVQATHQMANEQGWMSVSVSFGLWHFVLIGSMYDVSIMFCWPYTFDLGPGMSLMIGLTSRSLTRTGWGRRARNSSFLVGVLCSLEVLANMQIRCKALSQKWQMGPFELPLILDVGWVFFSSAAMFRVFSILRRPMLGTWWIRYYSLCWNATSQLVAKFLLFSRLLWSM